MEAFRFAKSEVEFKKQFPNDDRPDAINWSIAAVRMSEIALRLGSARRETAAWNAVSKKRVLDLGCGSSERIDGFIYGPYLARLLSAQGAIVFGIDLGKPFPEDAEIYTHIKTDIIPLVMTKTLHALPQISDMQFDIVDADAFVGENPSPTLVSKLKSLGYTEREFSQLLLQQIAEMTTDGGIILFGEKHFKKSGNALIEFDSENN